MCITTHFLHLKLQKRCGLRQLSPIYPFSHPTIIHILTHHHFLYVRLILLYIQFPFVICTTTKLEKFLEVQLPYGLFLPLTIWNLKQWKLNQGWTERLKQRDHEFKDTLGNTASLSLAWGTSLFRPCWKRKRKGGRGRGRGEERKRESGHLGLKNVFITLAVLMVSQIHLSEHVKHMEGLCTLIPWPDHESTYNSERKWAGRDNKALS